MRKILLAVLLLITVPVMAQQRFVIGVVTDGPGDRFSFQHQKYVDELLALTSSEFDVEIRRLPGNWTRDSMLAVLDSAFANPDVDMVLSGPATTEHVRQACDALAKGPLDPQELAWMRRVGDHVYGRSPVRALAD